MFLHVFFRHEIDEFQHEGYGGSEHGFNMVRDHTESYDGDYNDENADGTQLASNAAEAPHDAPRDHSQREFIVRIGTRFANGKVHRAIRCLLNEGFDGAWSTYREVPKEVVDRLFDRFRTRYAWDQENDEAIREGFETVLKRRFPDIMSEFREESATKAREHGADFPIGENDFTIMRDYPPRLVHLDIWHKLCEVWNTDKWQKKSEKGKKNRKKADEDDVISRHTGGSRGYDEHRIILERQLGRPPTFKELFLATHLDKDSKKKFWAGFYDESLEGAVFCTTRSKKSYEAYRRYMIEKYGEDVTQHPVGDVDLWERAQERRGFGVGSSDHSFVITGTPSSSSGAASYSDYQRSQEKVRSLESQVKVLHNLVEEVREETQRQIAELLKKFGNPDNSQP